MVPDNYSRKQCTFLLDCGAVGGAMVLGKRPVPGRPANLDNSRATPIALAVGAGGSCLDNFLSSVIFLFFLPLFVRLLDIDCNTASQDR